MTFGYVTPCILAAILALQLSSAEFNFEECSKSKSCVTSPSGCQSEEKCEYAFSYAKEGSGGGQGALEMELFTKRKAGSVGYVAVGFSSDQSMGEEGVTACVVDGDKVEVHLSRNEGQSNAVPATASPESETVEMRDFKLTYDAIYCKFAQRSHAGSNDLMQPDLGSRPYHFLLARGPSHSGRLDPHSFAQGPDYPFVSPAALQLFAAPTAGSSRLQNQQSADDPESGPFGLRKSSKFSLVKLHGFLMIVAWLGLVAIAVYTARYMRPMWDEQHVCGVKLWFCIHRVLNVAAVGLIVLSSLCVFVAKDLRWTGPWFSKTDNLTVGRIHSLVGIVSVILAVSQPLNSFLRCVPDHPKRYQFNLAHRSIGLAAATLALIATCIAVVWFQRYWASPALALTLLILFALATASLVVVSEVTRRKLAHEQRKMSAMELNTRGNKSRRSPPPSHLSDAYHYQAQNRKNMAKPASFAKLLFASALCVFSLTVILYAVLIWAH